MKPAPPLPDHPRLFDERARPCFAEIYRTLLFRATKLDVALTRIRLSALEIGPGELEGLDTIRLLLAEVSAAHLDLEAHAVMLRPDRRETLQKLSALLSRGVVEVRSAPLAGWSPDFSVFGGLEGPAAVLLGFHWFERPFPHRGPAFASVHMGAAAELASARFEELWGQGHDIGAAVLGILERAESAERRSATRVPEPPPGAVGA